MQAVVSHHAWIFPHKKRFRKGRIRLNEQAAQVRWVEGFLHWVIEESWCAQKKRSCFLNCWILMKHNIISRCMLNIILQMHSVENHDSFWELPWLKFGQRKFEKNAKWIWVQTELQIKTTQKVKNIFSKNKLWMKDFPSCFVWWKTHLPASNVRRCPNAKCSREFF